MCGSRSSGRVPRRSGSCDGLRRSRTACERLHRRRAGLLELRHVVREEFVGIAYPELDMAAGAASLPQDRGGAGLVIVPLPRRRREGEANVVRVGSDQSSAHEERAWNDLPRSASRTRRAERHSRGRRRHRDAGGRRRSARRFSPEPRYPFVSPPLTPSARQHRWPIGQVQARKRQISGAASLGNSRGVAQPGVRARVAGEPGCRWCAPMGLAPPPLPEVRPPRLPAHCLPGPSRGRVREPPHAPGARPTR